MRSLAGGEVGAVRRIGGWIGRATGRIDRDGAIFVTGGAIGELVGSRAESLRGVRRARLLETLRMAGPSHDRGRRGDLCSRSYGSS